jgi:hypothetical protein
MIYWKHNYKMYYLSRLPPKLVPLLVRAAFGGRRHHLSSFHRSTFIFPFVWSVLYTPGSHYVVIISLFNPPEPSWFCACLLLSVVSFMWFWIFVLIVGRLFLSKLLLLLISVSCAWLRLTHIDSDIPTHATILFVFILTSTKTVVKINHSYWLGGNQLLCDVETKTWRVYKLKII